MSARWVKRRLLSEALSSWTLFSQPPSGRHSRTSTKYPTWSSSKVCLSFSRHVSTCFLDVCLVAAQNACTIKNICHCCTSCGATKTQKTWNELRQLHVPKAAMNWHYTLGCCHEIWAYRLTVLILEKGEFIPLDLNMPRKTRTMSMTPFVIACECQANFRQPTFTFFLSEASTCSQEIFW